MRPIECGGYVSTIFWLCIISLQLYAGSSSQEPMAMRADAEVIKALGSRNPEEAEQARQAVLARGERMIPLLLQNKGDKRDYRGGGFGKETAAWAFLIRESEQKPKKDSPPVLTVEIFSLYLISGLYYGHFDFAEGPVLAYRPKPGKEQVINNNSKMLRRVYEAYAEWVAKVKTEGLAAMRQKKEPPLTGTKFNWW